MVARPHRPQSDNGLNRPKGQNGPASCHLSQHLTLNARAHARCAAAVWVRCLWESHTPMAVCLAAWEEWWAENLHDLRHLAVPALRCLRTTFNTTFLAAVRRTMAGVPG